MGRFHKLSIHNNMCLIIVRHGETIENAKGIIQGHLPGKLSENGIKQSKKLAKELKNEKIDLIYSSDLNRTADTVKEIAKYHLSVPVFYSKDIRERAFGRMQGKSIDDPCLKQYRCESNQSIVKRSKRFLHKISLNNAGKSILIVGHGGSIGALMANLLNCSFDEILKMGKVDNASITVFDPVPELKLFNYTGYLD